MNKIVCDVCGSTYSETEAQCPICGTAKSDEAKPIVETTGDKQTANGGKFSRSNTRKSGSADTQKGGQKKTTGQEGAPSNLAMIIIVGVLLLAIVAVCVFLFTSLGDNDEPTVPPTNKPTQLQIPCTGIALVDNEEKLLVFLDLAQTAQLTVKPIPENTTETVTFTYTSSDPTVVLVDENGLVTPVANGTATITVSYGSHIVTVGVTCNVPKPIAEIKLKKDITLNATNTTAQLYEGSELDPSELSWTSSNESIASVENGVVTALSEGTAIITAAYGDLTATCTVRVESMAKAQYMFAHFYAKNGDEDFESTMQIGESLVITFINSETKEEITGVTWSGSADFFKCCQGEATGNGYKITATATTQSSDISGGYVRVIVTYEGQEYYYIIRVSSSSAG